MAMIRALLIEDEPNARLILRRMLAHYANIQVVGESGSLRGARSLLARGNYNLVFLDIRLADGSGFDLVPLVRRHARIIFVTAHDEHALRAFEVNALDYLTKPLASWRLAESLRRFTGQAPELQPGAARPLADDDLALLPAGDHQRFASLRQIVLIEAHGNYSLVRLADGGREMVRRGLKAWVELLPAGTFLRVHRTAVVNLAHATGYRRNGPKSVSLHLSHLRRPVPVSREQWAAVQRLRPDLPRER